jgi:hypothetical protein
LQLLGIKFLGSFFQGGVFAIKQFTVQEADNLLPAIEKELLALKNIKEDFESQYAQLQRQKAEAKHGQIRSTSTKDPFFDLEAKIDFLQIEAQTHIQNIEKQGIILRDIDLGLIDFPAIINGEEVLLCWKLGEEKKIRFYHGLNEGYMGRKRLDEV